MFTFPITFFNQEEKQQIRWGLIGENASLDTAVHTNDVLDFNITTTPANIFGKADITFNSTTPHVEIVFEPLIGFNISNAFVGICLYNKAMNNLPISSAKSGVDVWSLQANGWAFWHDGTQQNSGGDGSPNDSRVWSVSNYKMKFEVKFGVITIYVNHDDNSDIEVYTGMSNLDPGKTYTFHAGHDDVVWPADNYKLQIATMGFSDTGPPIVGVYIDEDYTLENNGMLEPVATYVSGSHIKLTNDNLSANTGGIEYMPTGGVVPTWTATWTYSRNEPNTTNSGFCIWFYLANTSIAGKSYNQATEMFEWSFAFNPQDKWFAIYKANNVENHTTSITFNNTVNAQYELKVEHTNGVGFQFYIDDVLIATQAWTSALSIYSHTGICGRATTTSSEYRLYDFNLIDSVA